MILPDINNTVPLAPVGGVWWRPCRTARDHQHGELLDSLPGDTNLNPAYWLGYADWLAEVAWPEHLLPYAMAVEAGIRAYFEACPLALTITTIALSNLGDPCRFGVGVYLPTGERVWGPLVGEDEEPWIARELSAVSNVWAFIGTYHARRSLQSKKGVK